jgi:phosphohistidine phosphatase
MQLYLMRHGAAVNIGQRGVTRDAERMLSEEGIEKTRGVAEGLRTVLDAPLARIIASPLIRAKQTAEIAAKISAPDVNVETADVLQPDAEAADAIAWLGGQPAGPTMLVGHMPNLSALASLLVSGTHRAGFQFRKSAILCVQFDGKAAAGKGEVVWFLQPGMLRRLARG